MGVKLPATRCEFCTYEKSPERGLQDWQVVMAGDYATALAGISNLPVGSISISIES